MRLVKDNPELYDELGHDAFFDRYADAADVERKRLRESGSDSHRDWSERTERELAEAERFHDMEPGRWGDHASPARMRRDIAREREEERYRNG